MGKIFSVIWMNQSMAELEAKSSKHIRFIVSDTAQASRILEHIFHENRFTIQGDHNIQVHNLDLPIGKIITAFVENSLEVSEAAAFRIYISCTSYSDADDTENGREI